MLTISDDERALRMQLMTDFNAYSRSCLFVRSKSGAVQKLHMNRSQAYLHARLEKQLTEKGKVRALVLKGRQIRSEEPRLNSSHGGISRMPSSA